MTSSQKTKNKQVLFAILGIIAFGVIIALFQTAHGKHSQVAESQHKLIAGTILPQARVISDFTFTSNTNKRYTKQNLLGHWTIMFFGYTHCDYICPITMASLAKMYRTLEGEISPQQLPTVVMVSVDPARDSAKAMNRYIKSFNKTFIGIRSNKTETAALEKQMNVASQKAPQKTTQNNQNYTVTHSAQIMVLNPQGNLQAFLSYPHEADQMAKDFITISHMK